MAKKKQAPQPMEARAKIWLEIDGEYAFGYGVCRILEAVDETGSIKQAAAAIGKSYRHVWSRLKDVERQLGISLVETQVGGGDSRRSKLTDQARTLVSEYRILREDVFRMVVDRFGTTLRNLPPSATRR